jgi:peptidoglycan/LPS O-acetylase OafA/YrhL
MPMQPDSAPARPAPAARKGDRPDLPGPVSKVTTLLMVLIGLTMIGPILYLLGAAYAMVTRGEVLWIGLAAGAIGLAINLLLLLLVKRVRQGRQWAWITLLVILSLYAALFALAGLYDLTANGSYGLLLAAAVPALMIVLLTAPRRTRQYFRRNRGGR